MVQLSIRSVTVFGSFMIALGLLAGAALADDDMFPYAMPWDDVSSNLTNISAWNEKPAGKHGFITVRDGHLYEGGKRLRLMGVNITFAANFPTHAQADQIAARMARFGINIVRCHHMDSRTSPDGIMQKDNVTFDPIQLDRLDYFIAALKKQGIYTDLNLHVGRTYPGFAQWHDGKGNLTPIYWKGVDNFFPPMIALQQDYAHMLLTHYNTYTRTHYVDEPAIAFVEINNEDGLIHEWMGGALDGMTPPILSELTGQWNGWLRKRYASTDALKKTWGLYSAPLGNEMFVTAKANYGWVLQSVSPAQSHMNVQNSNIALVVDKVDGTNWHVQLHQNGLSFKANRLYTIDVNLRADHPVPVSFSAMQNHAPWKNLWRTVVDVGAEWKHYQFSFAPSEEENNARFTLGGLGTKTGTFMLAGASLKPGGELTLKAGESLEAGTMLILSKNQFQGYTGKAQRDWLTFLWDTESNYWVNMRDFLKEKLADKSLIIGTQVSYSPAPIQAQMDVVDGHAYWQHPVFPGKPWDGSDWYILNTPMAGDAAGGTLSELALRRIAGKPFIVSEYNHPFPSAFASEGFPVLAAYAALQDWDAIFAFDYENKANYDPEYIDDYFGINADPDKMSGMVIAAALFRRSDVATSHAADLPEPSYDSVLETMRTSMTMPSADKLGAPRNAALLQPVSFSTAAGNALPLPIESVTKQLVWGAGNYKTVTVDTPKSKGIIGAKLAEPFRGSGVELQLLNAQHDTAVVFATLMNGANFSSHGHILITALGKEENSSQIWQENHGHPTLAKNMGYSPVRVEGVAARITLPVAASRVRAFALDARGKRRTKLAVSGGKEAVIETDPRYQSLWYEVEIK